MKKSKDSKSINMKKYIVGIILILITTITIVVLAVNTNSTAENSGATEKVIEDEKSMVRMTVSLSRLNSSDSKVNAETLLTGLNTYAGNGKATVAEKDGDSDTLVVTFVATGNQYEVNVNTGPVFEAGYLDGELPSTEYTTPYLPTGFSYAEGDLDTGLVIEDSSGNQYVWVEVPQTDEVYPTAGVNVTSFSEDEYTKIENDLHTYTSVYRTGSYTDTWYSEAQHGFASADEYNALKKKMLKSVYQNGGFYVGRYEAGIIESDRDYGEDHTTEHPITETAVSQANAYPYNWVRCSQAQTLASNMNSGEYTSSLMFGVQWDLVLKYLETKGTTQDELKLDSTNWGNYGVSEYTIANANGKYNAVDLDTYLLTEWLPTTSYSKESGEITVLTTGASDTFSKQNIYDLAGNMREWTLEKMTSSSSYPCVARGEISYGYAAFASEYIGASYSGAYYGFRPSIF